MRAKGLQQLRKRANRAHILLPAHAQPKKLWRPFGHAGIGYWIHAPGRVLSSECIGPIAGVGRIPRRVGSQLLIHGLGQPGLPEATLGQQDPDRRPLLLRRDGLPAASQAFELTRSAVEAFDLRITIHRDDCLHEIQARSTVSKSLSDARASVQSPQPRRSQTGTTLTWGGPATP